MTKSTEFLKRARKKVLYFRHPIEPAVFKITRSKSNFVYFVKLGNDPEFKTEPGSKLVTDALLQLEEITQEEYENFGGWIERHLPL